MQASVRRRAGHGPSLASLASASESLLVAAWGPRASNGASLSLPEAAPGSAGPASGPAMAQDSQPASALCPAYRFLVPYDICFDIMSYFILNLLYHIIYHVYDFMY